MSFSKNRPEENRHLTLDHARNFQCGRGAAKTRTVHVAVEHSRAGGGIMTDVVTAPFLYDPGTLSALVLTMLTT